MPRAVSAAPGFLYLIQFYQVPQLFTGPFLVNGVITIVYYTGLARVAKRTGYPVVEVKGWKKRGYGQMVKAESVMCHHTAGPRTGNFPSLNVVTHGRPGVARPPGKYVNGTVGASCMGA